MICQYLCYIQFDVFAQEEGMANVALSQNNIHLGTYNEFIEVGNHVTSFEN